MFIIKLFIHGLNCKPASYNAIFIPIKGRPVAGGAGNDCRGQGDENKSSGYGIFKF
jgi:hypothetical protein